MEEMIGYREVNKSRVESEAIYFDIDENLQEEVLKTMSGTDMIKAAYEFMVMA